MQPEAWSLQHSLFMPWSIRAQVGGFWEGLWPSFPTVVLQKGYTNGAKSHSFIASRSVQSMEVSGTELTLYDA
jgi:hypothetical protein